MTVLCPLNIWYSSVPHIWETALFRPSPGNMHRENVLKLPPRVVAWHQKYIKDELGPRLSLEPWLRTFHLPLPNFYGGENAKICVDLRPHCSLRCSGFKTKEHIGNLESVWTRRRWIYHKLNSERIAWVSFRKKFCREARVRGHESYTCNAKKQNLPATFLSQTLQLI